MYQKPFGSKRGYRIVLSDASYIFSVDTTSQYRIKRYNYRCRGGHLNHIPPRLYFGELAEIGVREPVDALTVHLALQAANGKGLAGGQGLAGDLLFQSTVYALTLSLFVMGRRCMCMLSAVLNDR